MEVLNISVLTLIAVVGVCLFSATSQTVTGFGFSLLSVPLLSFIVDVHTAVIASTALSCCQSSIVAVKDRSAVRWSASGAVTAAAVPGVGVGVIVFGAMSAQLLLLIVAVVMLLLSAIIRFAWWSSPRKDAVLLGGFASGMMLATSGMNGPPLFVALRSRCRTPRELRSTLQVSFVIQDVMTLAGYYFGGADLPSVAMIVVAGISGVILGVVVGNRVFGLISMDTFRKLAFGVILASAMVLLLRSIET